MSIIENAKKERAISQSIEDSMINEFIEKDLPNWDPVGRTDEPIPYLRLSGERKRQADLDAFKFFLERQKVQSTKNAKIGSLSYDAFLKIDRPETDLKNALVLSYKPDVPDDPNATIWNNLFAQNTGALKDSARNGKILLEGAETQRKRESYLKRP